MNGGARSTGENLVENRKSREKSKPHLHGKAREPQKWDREGTVTETQGGYSTLTSDSIWNEFSIISAVAKRPSKKSTDTVSLHLERRSLGTFPKAIRAEE